MTIHGKIGNFVKFPAHLHERSENGSFNLITFQTMLDTNEKKQNYINKFPHMNQTFVKSIPIQHNISE